MVCVQLFIFLTSLVLVSLSSFMPKRRVLFGERNNFILTSAKTRPVWGGSCKRQVLLLLVFFGFMCIKSFVCHHMIWTQNFNSFPDSVISWNVSRYEKDFKLKQGLIKVLRLINITCAQCRNGTRSPEHSALIWDLSLCAPGKIIRWRETLL